MKYTTLTIIIALGSLSISNIAQAQSVRGERPTDLIAADLEIEEQVFIDCFSGVNPARNHSPSGARQRMNKSVLLPCLQKANPAITNDSLDTVMGRYRPESPMRG